MEIKKVKKYLAVYRLIRRVGKQYDFTSMNITADKNAFKTFYNVEKNVDILRVIK